MATLAAFVFGLTVLVGAFYPISGNTFVFFKPFYIYLCGWLAFGILWSFFAPNRRIELATLGITIVLFALLLPLWTVMRFNHERRLFDAARNGHLLILKAELAFYGKTKTDLNESFIAASIGGENEVLRYLLRQGANPNARLFDDNTALMLAAASSSKESVQALLESGAEVDAKNKDGMTALMWAAKTNQVEAVEVLLSAKADRSLRNNVGESAQMIAQKFHFDRVDLILRQ